MRFFLCLFYMFHRRYSNCRPLNSARYNRIICQRVENTSFFERLSCILHALAKGYQGYKSNFGSHVPFDCEIWQIQDQKSVFGFAERNTPNVTTPLTNHRFLPYSEQIFRHQYGISVAKSQTLFLAKQPQRRRARRNGCFSRFFFHFSVFLNLSFPESSSEIILPFLKRQKRRSVDT